MKTLKKAVNGSNLRTKVPIRGGNISKEVDNIAMTAVEEIQLEMLPK